MARLKNIKLYIKISFLIFISLNLCACYDAMYLDEPTQRVNRNYGFYQFYDNPYSYNAYNAHNPHYSSPSHYSSPYYNAPYLYEYHDDYDHYDHYDYDHQPRASHYYPQAIPQIYNNHYYHYNTCHHHASRHQIFPHNASHHSRSPSYQQQLFTYYH